MKLNTLGDFLTPKLRDDEDINRQVRYLHITANRLTACFYNCSTKIKNVWFHTYCSSLYACQLSENLLFCSFKRMLTAYNNSF